MAEQDAPRVSGLAYVFYYIVLFFAYWFGSARFDVDGDGDFDPTDVQAYLQDNGVIRKNNRRVVKRRQTTSIVRASEQNSGRPSSKVVEEQAQSKALVDAESGLGPPGEQDGEASQPVEPEETQDDGQGSIALSKPKNDDDNPGDWWDRDGNGEVGLNDFLETKVEGDAAEEIAMQNLVSGQIRPWFIIFECLVTILLWLCCVIIWNSGDLQSALAEKAGLESIWKGQTDLRISGPECEDIRHEAWRWLSYQFTHIGAAHVLMNAFLNLMLGVPLEGLHGHFRMALMFNAGVLGGALCNFLGDGHTPVVGCSGGVYALIGIQIADLIMNWRQKKFRLPTLLFLVILIGADLLSTVTSISEGTSHWAHAGGAISGFLMGILMVKNLRWHCHERVFFVMALVLGLAWVSGCLAWLFMQTNGPRSLSEFMAGEPGWCWHRQVYNKTFLDMGLGEVAQCVRCGNLECIQRWKTCIVVGEVKYSFCANTMGWLADER